MDPLINDRKRFDIAIKWLMAGIINGLITLVSIFIILIKDANKIIEIESNLNYI